MKRLLSILPILLLVLISCEREITYHGEYDDPKLVVQAILYAGEDSIDCFVDRSYFFLDKKPNTKEPLSDAIIQIESASNPSLRLVRLRPVGACYRLYLSEPLQTNDTIRLSVTHPEYGTARAEEVIVPRFKVQLKSSVWDTKKGECRAVFDFPDSPNLSNSLNVTAIVRWSKVYIYTETKNGVQTKCDTSYSNSSYSKFESNHPIFASTQNSYDASKKRYYGTTLYFTGDYTSAKDVEIIMPINLSYDTTYVYNYSNGVTKYEYTTYTVDTCVCTFGVTGQTFDTYMKSMRAYMGYSDEPYDDMDLGAMFVEMLGVEEPVPVYTNVENGFGLVASKSRDVITITDIQKE